MGMLLDSTIPLNHSAQGGGLMYQMNSHAPLMAPRIPRPNSMSLKGSCTSEYVFCHSFNLLGSSHQFSPEKTSPCRSRRFHRSTVARHSRSLRQNSIAPVPSSVRGRSGTVVTLWCLRIDGEGGSDETGSAVEECLPSSSNLQSLSSTSVSIASEESQCTPSRPSAMPVLSQPSPSSSLLSPRFSPSLAGLPSLFHKLHWNSLWPLWRSLGTAATSVALLVSLGAPFSPAQALVQAPPRKLQADEEAVVQLFRDNTPSVVYITNLAVRRDVFTLDVMAVPQGSGSGFIWDTQGHVVTNYHVIRGASDLRVTLGDQSVYEAKVVGLDEDKDVAVLHISAPPEKLRPLPVGSSSDLLVGQKVYAIGNPFGLDHTLTTGVISGLRREISSASTGRPIQDVIQTDAAINPGNSGGPLLDSSGNLIGINTAIYSPSGASSGVGFSIPVDTVSGIVEQIVRFGKVTRPVLGISFAPEQSVESLGFSGVLVLDAPVEGPAGKAGLRSSTRDTYGRLVLGDIITGINGSPVKSGSDLYRILDRCKVGQTVDVEVLRGEAKEIVKVTLEPKD
eukprot:TRINITY_DN29472_c0_g1_i1.p1 TRINITY_DN29472_c0_g1~~TRINITY_DN29472_c0_g1_i1.p1  ORF type:complete len:600 (-),score=92.39 TRINITY_DN29472_c0_g1_i1:580-2268(-)